MGLFKVAVSEQTAQAGIPKFIVAKTPYKHLIKSQIAYFYYLGLNKQY